MKTIQKTKEEFQCDYCDKTSKFPEDIEKHEELHKIVEGLSIGEEIIFEYPDTYSDWGHEYTTTSRAKGIIIDKNVKKQKFLVETKNKERTWYYLWNNIRILPAGTPDIWYAGKDEDDEDDE